MDWCWLNDRLAQVAELLAGGIELGLALFEPVFKLRVAIVAPSLIYVHRETIARFVPKTWCSKPDQIHLPVGLIQP